MSNDNAGEAIGTLIAAVFIIGAVLAAAATIAGLLTLIAATGSCWGAIRALANYGRALKTQTSLLGAAAKPSR